MLKDSAFRIEEITVRDLRIECKVRIAQDTSRYTSPEIAANLSRIYPTLAHHSCSNSHDKTFGAVYGHTSLAHLFEHLVIDIQTRGAQNRAQVFVGTTEWVDEKRGLARVEVSFTDDLVTLRAFCEASHAINEALLQ
jgi:hypothetical protein